MENLYIPEEIAAYKQNFEALGAEVHLLSRLWGNPSVKFVSDPDGLDEYGNPRQAETIEVNLDLDKIRLEDYAAIIMAANYTSVRLRYYQYPEEPSDAPAVKFFARAMQNPKIIKGALCHGLWILTPNPQYLKGRRIICHEVVRSDICNAGAIYTANERGVVVDGDLVTGRSKAEVHLFIQAIAQAIKDLDVKNANAGGE
ncbi:MAG: DJ-1/PfpI family protein [Candidatus Bathyarchaeota archaeon]|nr:DJ-1/PfpI family protein [Candidatus Bathyarchaeota archaeon]